MTTEEDDFDQTQWSEELQSHREQKDEMFADHPQSPIPPEEREDFDGLDYFDPDPKYRVTADVEVHDQPEPVEMDVSAGRPQRYLRVATLRFSIDEEAYELTGYQQESQDGLFVPFRDKTTGQQTYKDGRYMEFEPEADLAEIDEMTLDFNLAYSPFCAFSETFSCPLAPEENWLDVEILAGEKDY
ncbi:DUF1684 domain-containing protein [Halorussus halophilus]|uniref:DUF1684 domain-containing protein n=1 Tax=Halorussus halophilus TaxID=2650975 RepID=UPI001300D9C0|nr:DUF1684 domain-containing protein [Halorussus halophilus]